MLKCLYIFFILVLVSCKHHEAKKEISGTTDTVKASATKIAPPEYEKGDRFKLAADLNGDGKKDTIYESYISELTGQETFKEVNSDTIDIEKERDIIYANKPICRLYTNIQNVDTLIMQKDANIGLDFLSNLGDLNGDGGDEVGCIVHNNGFSNLNTYYILSLTDKNKLDIIFQFQIFEELLYEDGQEKELTLFKNHDFVIKSGPNKFKYKLYTDSATVETMETTLPNRK